MEYIVYVYMYASIVKYFYYLIKYVVHTCTRDIDVSSLNWYNAIHDNVMEHLEDTWNEGKELPGHLYVLKTGCAGWISLLAFVLPYYE